MVRVLEGHGCTTGRGVACGAPKQTNGSDGARPNPAARFRKPFSIGSHQRFRSRLLRARAWQSRPRGSFLCEAEDVIAKRERVVVGIEPVDGNHLRKAYGILQLG